MFEKLEIFRMAQAMAQHAGARQAVVAQNMANADTPGYRAREIAPFQAAYQAQRTAFDAYATRPGHFRAETPQPGFVVIADPTAVADPNGNSVSLETEMMRAVDVKQAHDRALAIYRSSLDVLRLALGRR